ncbi:Na+/H+ antiporter subunit E [Nocardia paucivorans]|uniref:Na+/H+ antiporter subunit E n=1 Tax=Nocardia paucivorans TaxID=114259 RepID=UPI00059278C8|nr:Na+/H+ antiporter subunit E [Nocardia paucivorans]
MSRESMVRIGVLAWLTAVWVLLWGQVDIANVLGGLVVGLVIMLALPLPQVPVRGRLRILPLLRLIGVSIYYALESSLQVAWFAIRPAPPPISGVLRVRFRFTSDLVMVLCANLLNSIPGTVVLEIDRERRVVYVHVIDIGSAEAVDKFNRINRRLEQLLIEAFEQPTPEVSS